MLTRQQTADVIRWIKQHKDSYIDPITREYQLTQLSEACASALGIYDRNYDIPEDIFELAYEQCKVVV